MDIQLTETKVFDIEQPQCNPVAIYWLKNGAWNYWVFGCRQINSIDVSDGGVFESFIDDLQTATKRGAIISKSVFPKMTLGYDNLPTNKVEGIKTLLQAVAVKMLISDKSVRPPVFLDVAIVPGSFILIDTSVDFHNLEITISLPELFNEER